MTYGEENYGSDGYLGATVHRGQARLTATASVTAKLRMPQSGAVYGYANIGINPVSSQEGTVYGYEHVIYGGQAQLVGTADLKVRRVVPGSGGYGSSRYGGFRYGMGENFYTGPVPSLGEAHLEAEASFYGLPSVHVQLARLSAEVAMHNFPADMNLARFSVEVIFRKPSDEWSIGWIRIA